MQVGGGFFIGFEQFGERFGWLVFCWMLGRVMCSSLVAALRAVSACFCDSIGRRVSWVRVARAAVLASDSMRAWRAVLTCSMADLSSLKSSELMMATRSLRVRLW